MRLSILLVAAHCAALGRGSSGSAAGWGGLARQKSTAADGRRVFSRRGPHSDCCCSVLAFGSSPSSRGAERKLEATEAASAAGVLTEVGAGEVVTVGGSKDAAAAVGTSAAGASPEPASMVQGLVNTVKDFLVDAKTGTVALWTNFQVSQDIRKRVKGGHQLTYAEHTHLERGSNDRRKLLQFVIIYAISPETFPYVVLYAPSLLPSTYEKPHAVRSLYTRLSHERVNAALGGIAQLEKQLIDVNAKFKGKAPKKGTRPAKRVEALEVQREQTLEILGMGSKREIFEKFQKHMVTPDPVLELAKSDKKQKKPQKLPSAGSGVPGPAIKALGRGMGMAGWRGIAPGFYVKYRLNEHVKDLGKGDAILRRLPLDSLSDADLKEACNSRAIDVAGGSREPKALRRALAEWLELTSAEVAARNAAPDMVFLPDRARLLGLGLNILEGSRQGESGVLSRRALLNSW